MNRHDDENVEYTEEYVEEYVTTVPGAFDHDMPRDIYERVLRRVPVQKNKRRIDYENMAEKKIRS